MNDDTLLTNARTLLRQGQVDAAREICREICYANSNNPDALHLLGLIELQKGRAGRGIRNLRQAAQLAPERTDISNDLGKSLYESDRVAEAIETFQRAGSQDPNFAKALVSHGMAQHRLGRTDLEEAAFRKALEIDPGLDVAKSLLAFVLNSKHQYAEAVEILEALLEKSPENVENMNFLATAYERLSRVDEAETLIDRILEIDPENADAALEKAKLDKNHGEFNAARQRLTRLIETNGFVSAPWHPLREIAEVYDREGDFGPAFDSFSAANQAQLASHPGGEKMAAEYRRFVEDSNAWFTADRVAKWPPPPPDGIRPPVFFVGFPRSGTTLMEEVLASHPDIVTSQEGLEFTRVVDALDRRSGGFQIPGDFDTLSDGEVLTARKAYLDQAGELLDDDLTQRQLIDKLPLGMANIPINNRIFADAKVIVAIRDPRDVCLSCFMQYFQLNGAMLNFLDIEATARLYKTVMGLWLDARKVTTMQWMEYRYEDLVDDFQGTVGQVLDFLDLPWNDAVTRYAENSMTRKIQTPSFYAVKQQLYKGAIGRWRNYREQLAPVLPALRPFVEEFGYEPS